MEGMMLALRGTAKVGTVQWDRATRRARVE